MVKKRKQTKRTQTKWMKHLLAFKKAHPGKSLTECMSLAKKTYKK